jgi:hypothetical protein
MPIIIPAAAITTTVNLNYQDWPMILRFRQEVNPFHYSCLHDTVLSLSKSFAANRNESNDLKIFLQNIFLIYDWDFKNKNYMR